MPRSRKPRKPPRNGYVPPDDKLKHREAGLLSIAATSLSSNKN
jgi:hypothetical protein